MRVLVAFDKFKDALSSPEACAIAGRALATVHPEWELDLCPLADGGEGFCDILTRSAGGTFETVRVTGPRGAFMDAPVGFAALEKIPTPARALLSLGVRPMGSDRVAIIEMAAASGLALLAPDARDPWQTTSRGTGELIRFAAERGAAGIVLGVGGSATNDLGLGALAALGLEFRDSHGMLVDPPIPADWHRIARIAGTFGRALPPLRIACDVTNPLLGPRGAAAVYGPQKGLHPRDHARLDHAAARLALLLCHHFRQPDSLLETPGAGAAGGISFGLMAAMGAQLLSGFDLVTAWLDLDRRLAAADLVLTGEGRFDDSSLAGKGPGAIVARALATGKRAHVFAGHVTLTTPPSALQGHAISPPDLPLPDALARAGDNLARAIAATFSGSGD